MELWLFLLIPAAASALCLLVRPGWVLELVNLAAFAATFILSLFLAGRVLESGPVSSADFLRADALSAWMVLLIAVVSFSSSFYARGYFRRDLEQGNLTSARFREFYVLTPLFAAAMFLVVLVDNLGIMWVATEVTALASVLLVALYNRKTSLEAAWKYIILGSFGLVLALFGTICMYAAAAPGSGAHPPEFRWSALISMTSGFNPQLVKLAFVFLLIGYGTKAGLAPMHNWLPDAHSEAPSPTSAMLSGVALKVALYALLRFHVLTTHALQEPFSRDLLLLFGLVSMLLAGPFILVQHNLKRLFAYSSLEHVGLICAGVALNAPLAIFGALLHMGFHALAKPLLFFASGNIHQHYHTLELRRIGGGLLKTMPATGVVLGLSVVAIAGLPPFGLFTSEFLVVSAGFASNQVLASSLMILALAVVFCGLLKQVSALVLGKPESPARPSNPAPGFWWMGTVPLLALLLLAFWLPDSAHQLLRQAAAILGSTS